jgi:hypothetical protein
MSGRRVHWIETAVGNGQPADGLLAEDERGDLWVPSAMRANWWDRRFNPRNPLHWEYWLRSRLRRNVVMIESSPSVPSCEGEQE